VKAHLPLAVLTLFIASFFLLVSQVLAQEPPQPQLPITVLTDSPLPLLVDGLPTDDEPAFVRLGAEVCAGSEIHYTSPSERWVFQGWEHGPPEQCVLLAEPGVYVAKYSHEVVLQVFSSVSEVQQSNWVPLGTPVELEVPATVEDGDRVRRRFIKWSGGETPFTPRNVIALLEPTALEVTWVKEYHLTVEGPENLQIEGSGW
jgi:hypothetical protein